MYIRWWLKAVEAEKQPNELERKQATCQTRSRGLEDLLGKETGCLHGWGKHWID